MTDEHRVDEPATERREEPQAKRPAPVAERPSDVTETPMAECEQTTPERAAAGTTTRAGAVGSIFTQGVDAVREMNSARRAHIEARQRLEEIKRRIEQESGEIERRRDIAARHGEIIAEQTARKDAAVKAAASAKAQCDSIGKEIEGLRTQLDQARADDAQTEHRLKAALDAAEAKEASARESGARLQRRLDEAKAALERAIPDKENGIAAARRSIDSAKNRLSTLRSERSEVDRNPSANSAAYSVRLRELDAEIADATHELVQAKEELPRITEELERALVRARTDAAEAEKPVEDARYAFRRIADDADRARDAYETEKSEAAERQRSMRERIASRERAVREQELSAERAEDEAEESQTVIDEAHDIFRHPEVTEQLAAQLSCDTDALKVQTGSVEALAAAELAVRERTRTSRVRFMATIAGIGATVIIICVVVWLILGSRG